jgi:hypothetical protein
VVKNMILFLDVVSWYWFYFTTPCLFENKPWTQFYMVTWPTPKLMWQGILENTSFHISKHTLCESRSRKTRVSKTENRVCTGSGRRTPVLKFTKFSYSLTPSPVGWKGKKEKCFVERKRGSEPGSVLTKTKMYWKSICQVHPITG